MQHAESHSIDAAAVAGTSAARRVLPQVRIARITIASTTVNTGERVAGVSV